VTSGSRAPSQASFDDREQAADLGVVIALGGSYDSHRYNWFPRFDANGQAVTAPTNFAK
jgi:hypothetical protein